MNTYGGGGESLAERQGFQDYDRVVPQTEKPNELNPYQSRPDITGMTFTGATGKETYKTPRTISDQKKYLVELLQLQKQVYKKFQVQLKLVLIIV
jgi:hypothetical protein